MDSLENPNFLLDYPLPAADFSALPEDFWAPRGLPAVSPNVSVDIDGTFVESVGHQESGPHKRKRLESCGGPRSKACREKMRRDKLNEKFLELSSILEPGKPPKMDKAAILSDAARMVVQLHSEAQSLKNSNESLQEKIKDLKTEKIELRDEKQKLKAERENLEQQLKFLSAQRSFMPHPPVEVTPIGFGAPSSGHKLMMPIISYPGFPMWQFMPASDVDTSQDAQSRPPVA